MKITCYNFLDKTRMRVIPVAVFLDYNTSMLKKIPVIFLNHGSDVPNTYYSYLAEFLQNKGYVVVCIQHDIIGDEPISLPKFQTGILKETRLPIWKMWILNMLFVIKELGKVEPTFDFKKFILIGHSTGADASMLFATKYPDLVSKVISLDGRRCPFPRNPKLNILLLQANDTTTDEGVIPILSEENNPEMKIIKIKNAHHMDYCDEGTKKVKSEAIKIIEKFLNCKN